MQPREKSCLSAPFNLCKLRAMYSVLGIWDFVSTKLCNSAAWCRSTSLACAHTPFISSYTDLINLTTTYQYNMCSDPGQLCWISLLAGPCGDIDNVVLIYIYRYITSIPYYKYHHKDLQVQRLSKSALGHHTCTTCRMNWTITEYEKKKKKKPKLHQFKPILTSS